MKRRSREWPTELDASARAQTAGHHHRPNSRPTARRRPSTRCSIQRHAPKPQRKEVSRQGAKHAKPHRELSPKCAILGDSTAKEVPDDHLCSAVPSRTAENSPPIQRWATSGRDAQARRGERRTQRCVPTSRGLEPAHAFFRHASPRLASHEPGVGPASAGDTPGTRRRIGPPDPAGVAEAHHTDHACRPPNRHAPQCRACLKRQLPNVDMRPYWLFLGLLRPGLQVDRRSVLLSCFGRHERHA